MNNKWGWGEKKFQWGGRREESMLIKKYADQWYEEYTGGTWEENNESNS